MKSIGYAILEYPGSIPSNCAGWRELFSMPNREPGSVTFHEVDPEIAEVLLIPGSLGSSEQDRDFSKVIEPLKRAHVRGALVASVCSGLTGVLLAGIDQGRMVTTHWSLGESLKQRFPSANIDTRDLIVDQGNLVTAGGVLAWIDLGLHLIGRLVSPKAARTIARVLVWDPGRVLQGPYAPPSVMTAPLISDPELLRAADWVKSHLRDCKDVNQWADAGALGKRTLERKWSAAYGRPPKAWLRVARIARARELMEETGKSWEAISEECGYQDPHRFAIVFKKEMGMSPAKYRKAFEFTGKYP